MSSPTVKIGIQKMDNPSRLTKPTGIISSMDSLVALMGEAMRLGGQVRWAERECMYFRIDYETDSDSDSSIESVEGQGDGEGPSDTGQAASEQRRK